ncbi:MAG: HEAT repeat domain-containing protein [Planctomycetota bacterium]|nr:HEAT repeat domain-containing protein [Planctomycetota bacterium]
MKKKWKWGILGSFVFLLSVGLFLIFAPQGNSLVYQYLLWSKNEKLRPWVMRNLQNLGPHGLSGLRMALSHENWEVQAIAADGIGKLGADGEDAVPDLVPLLKSENKDLRRRVVWALGNIGTKASIEGLATGLDDENQFVRQYVCEALEKAGPKAEFAVPQLAMRLEKDSFWEVRELSAKILGKLGPAAASALPTLEKSAKTDEDDDVKVACQEALTALKSS